MLPGPFIGPEAKDNPYPSDGDPHTHPESERGDPKDRPQHLRLVEAPDYRLVY